MRSRKRASTRLAGVVGVRERRRAMEGEFHGRVKDGKMHGYGICAYSDGSTYQGDFRDGLKCGRGTHSFASGDQFEGEWHDGWMHGLMWTLSIARRHTVITWIDEYILYLIERVRPIKS